MLQQPWVSGKCIITQRVAFLLSRVPHAVAQQCLLYMQLYCDVVTQLVTDKCHPVHAVIILRQLSLQTCCCNVGTASMATSHHDGTFGEATSQI